MLLNFTKHQFGNVASTLKQEGPEAAATRQTGTGQMCLARARNNISQITLQNATQAWISTLRRCYEVH